MANALDELGLRAGSAVARDARDLLGGHAVAAVRRAVQVKRGLGGVVAPGRLLLLGPFGRAESRRVELAPVVAERRLEVGGVADALLDERQVLARVVARRPVAPDAIDEGEVVGGDRGLHDMLELEVPEVERPLDLVVGAQVLAEDLERRDVDDDAAPPPVRPEARGAPRGDGAPVVGDENRVPAAAERLVEREDVGDHRARVDVVAVRRELRRREAPVERRDRPVPGRRQVGQQVAVGPGGVGEPVDAERQGSGPRLEVVELESVGLDRAACDLGHRESPPYGTT